MEFIFDRTESDIIHASNKAYLNASDINRVEENINELAGYVGMVLEYKTWKIGGLPRDSDFSRILYNIDNLKDKFTVWETTPVAPVQPLNTYQKWNDIEHILHDMYWGYMYNIGSRFYCGEDISCGDEIGVI